MTNTPRRGRMTGIGSKAQEITMSNTQDGSGCIESISKTLIAVLCILAVLGYESDDGLSSAYLVAVVECLADENRAKALLLATAQEQYYSERVLVRLFTAHGYLEKLNTLRCNDEGNKEGKS